ncbi:hypothetical protein [Halorubrum yunnanense]|uniref:Pyridine nucleotide-disulphide oxidoreductase dimerisation domain-containing protein n=1 Tax=Halorubrum yunnanense TaxID=1526162 RepID=A0ABD5YPB8_9EURY|nr:hypothetical protein [Halorubrum yunnanense]
MFTLPFDPGDGTIFGAQAIGESGVDKRIDVLATAIAHRDTVFDIRDYDLACAPPYPAAKDTVNVLGMIGANVVEGIADVVHLDELLERKDEATVIDTRPPEMRRPKDGSTATRTSRLASSESGPPTPTRTGRCSRTVRSGRAPTWQRGYWQSTGYPLAA